MRYLIVVVLFFVLAIGVSAQTATPGADPAIYATLTGGQMSKFVYSTTASDVQIANLTLLNLISTWAFFIVGVFVLARSKK